MSSGGGAFRVSIPSSVRKTIQNIQEITGNHGDEEIYAMLKECSMDPNETTQKLLHQDTFHEVKRKRDRKKENVNNREPGESRWRPGTQVRGGRGGRGNFSPRHLSHGGRNSGILKENGLPQGGEKVVSPLLTSHETKEKERSLVPSLAPNVSNGPSSVAHVDNTPAGGGPELSLPSVVDSAEVNKNPIVALANEDLDEELDHGSTNDPVPLIPTPASTVCFSPSDPVLLLSNDSRVPGAVGTIKREVGTQRSSGELNAYVHVENKSTTVSETSTYAQGKLPSKSWGVGKGQVTEFSQPSSTSTHAVSSTSRPSSNYSNRSSQMIGVQKGGSNKEWKPKAVQGSGTGGSSEAPTANTEATAKLQPVSNTLNSEDATSKLQKKLEELHIRQRQHVILPHHIHVPESERTKLSFGSFGSFFGVTSTTNVPESEKSPTPVTETSQDIEDNVEEQSSSNQNALETDEGDYSEHQQSPSRVPENLSSPEVEDVPSNPNTGHSGSKQDIELPSGGHQYSMVQHYDPTNYYAQFYRPNADIDGRLSPFLSPGVAAKYNGPIAVLPPQNSQSLQEGGVLSTGGPASMVTQGSGLMQNPIAVTQQPLPVFRPPTGMHISPHYPPNYFPYGHFFPPFYVPPPAIHQFLGNGAFPQQPQGGGMYPAPPTPGVKYSLPQYKQVTNTGNSGHIGMASGYIPYGSSPSGYNPETAGNSNTNEDLGQSQFKESNVYITGQQNEGTGLWVAAPGRDMSSLATSSFYNLPPQGQHMSFAPAHAGHGTYGGMYHHPAQAVTAATVHPLLQQSQTMAGEGAVDMVGPGGGVYQQQPQHAHMSWPSNY